MSNPMKLYDALDGLIGSKEVNGVVVELHSKKIAHEMTDVTRTVYAGKLPAKTFKMDSPNISISFLSFGNDFLILNDLESKQTKTMNVIGCGPFGESSIYVLAAEQSARMTQAQIKYMLDRIDRKEQVLYQFLENCQGAEFFVVYTE